MKFIIDKKIFNQFPDLSIGVLIAKDANNTKSVDEDISEMIKSEAKRINENFQSEKLSQDPKINCWRKAYRLFGGEPKKNRSSIENLYKNTLRGDSLRSINPLVDIYNYISLKYMLPLGGEDLDKMQGDLRLTYASADEKPIVLLGDHEAKPPHEGEIIYKDEDSTICRRWNWREADRSKLTDKTKDAIIVIESLPPLDQTTVQTALNELKNLVQKHCGGEIMITTLDKNKQLIEF